MMGIDLLSLELNKAQFEKIARLLYRLCGIALYSGKEELVKARLIKRLRELEMRDFEQYIRYVEQDNSGKELTIMTDMLTTNKTSFFREPQHFDYLRQQVLPFIRDRKICFWSAGCSSGEEPFSLAILLREEIPAMYRHDVRILSTDISVRMVKKAREAVYEQERLQGIPFQLLEKYFTCVKTKSQRVYRANNNIRAMVRVARLNLMEEWPMKGLFNVIFCRNVMIYFDQSTRQKLIHRFWELIRPGGYLFIGHSESLSGLSHGFRYIQPAVYMKLN